MLIPTSPILNNVMCFFLFLLLRTFFKMKSYSLRPAADAEAVGVGTHTKKGTKRKDAKVGK